jgi:hypothetical protein
LFPSLLSTLPVTIAIHPNDFPSNSILLTNHPQCRMALYQHISNSSIYLYGGAFKNFRSSPQRAIYSTDCQVNAVLHENNTKLYSYGIGPINDKNIVLQSGAGGTKTTVVATKQDNLANPL